MGPRSIFAISSAASLTCSSAPRAGGVAIGGQSDLPMGHAGMVDKLVGKTQKVRSRLRPYPSTCSSVRALTPLAQVAGKMTGNPEMHERGELRESGGKAAAEGMARAPHD